MNSRADPDQPHAQSRNRPKHRNRPLRGSGRKHQLEQGHGVADPLTDGPKRAITVVRGDDGSLRDEGTGCEAQQPIPPTCDRAEPDVADRGKEVERNQPVAGAPSDDCRR